MVDGNATEGAPWVHPYVTPDKRTTFASMRGPELSAVRRAADAPAPRRPHHRPPGPGPVLLPLGQPASTRSQEAPMSKLARALALGADGRCDEPGRHDRRRPGPSHRRPNQGKRRRPTTESQVGENWRERPAAPQQQAARGRHHPAAAGPGAVPIPNGAPTQVTSPTPAAEPSGQPGWLIPSLAVLAAALTLVAGVAAMAARRAKSSQRAGQTALRRSSPRTGRPTSPLAPPGVSHATHHPHRPASLPAL